MTHTEMISAKALCYKDRKTLKSQKYIRRGAHRRSNFSEPTIGQGGEFREGPASHINMDAGTENR